jgi:hypothetical protein
MASPLTQPSRVQRPAHIDDHRLNGEPPVVPTLDQPFRITGDGAETTASRSMRLGTAQGLSLYECPAQVSAFSCQQWELCGGNDGTTARG